MFAFITALSPLASMLLCGLILAAIVAGATSLLRPIFSSREAPQLTSWRDRHVKLDRDIPYESGRITRHLYPERAHTVKQRITPLTEQDEQTFFLLEVELGTEVQLVQTDSGIAVSRRDMQRLTEYFDMHTSKRDTAHGAFTRHGFELRLLTQQEFRTIG